MIKIRTTCSASRAVSCSHYRPVPCCRSVPDRDIRNSSVVAALRDGQDQVADRTTGPPLERSRVAGPAGTNCDLEQRATMLRDQTTRSKRAARQPNGRDRDSPAPHLFALETQKSGSDRHDSLCRPDRLVHGRNRHRSWCNNGFEGRASRSMKGSIT